MKAEIITIGDELLIGQVVDSNSAVLARQLDKIGVSVLKIISIGDEKHTILEALKSASKNTDIVVVTGGLGPTKDDLTKYTLCEFFGDELVNNQEVLRHIEKLFSSKLKDAPLSQLNREQALVPSKAQVLHNEFGTAPGLWMEQNNKVVIALPGVPYELKLLMENEVIPKLQKKFKRPIIYHKTIMVKGLTESALAEKIASWEDHLPVFLKLAYLPDFNHVRLRLSGKGEDEKAIKLAVEKQFAKLFDLLGNAASKETDEDEKIVVKISELLRKKGKFLSVAESCTGGALAAQFTTQPGASTCFKGGLVTYATQAKEDLLHIKKELIEKYSVVSPQVAETMAEEAKKVFNTDYALSTTGNAGPTKGDSKAPVGTVFIGLAGPEKTISKKFQFGNTREQVVEQTVNKAFELILRELTDKSK